jgi:hypothetical protein
VPSRYEQALAGCMQVSAITTCCKSIDSWTVTLSLVGRGLLRRLVGDSTS